MDELKQEMREDMLRESRMDEAHERQMHSDYEYAIEYVATQFNLDEALNPFIDALRELNEYGHEVSIHELVDEV